ncbi:hypothetical protein [Pandoraea communis]|uniref:Uncharacterized protein n=1 Tax=Pandoraea communis TaxID=2508297 RepID=A0A5E4Z1D1_9BURK|nr:hypothetical protein [Pandoraea communis]MDM8359163.1 hypothetical protein [Pandoraea communis]VVE54916.1 hypothetical protein PCO31111_05000 [Pandoraea communis]
MSSPSVSRPIRIAMSTAAVRKDGHVYVLNSRIDTLFKSGSPKIDRYILQQF